MRAEGLPTRPVAVQNAVLHVSNLVIVDKGIPLANGIRAKCIAQPVRVVAKRHLCPSNHGMASLSIAVIVINRNVLVAQTTDDRVGNIHDNDFGESRRLV